MWVQENKVILYPLIQNRHIMTITNISSEATGPIVTKFYVQPLWAEEQKFV